MLLEIDATNWLKCHTKSWDVLGPKKCDQWTEEVYNLLYNIKIIKLLYQFRAFQREVVTLIVGICGQWSREFHPDSFEAKVASKKWAAYVGVCWQCLLSNFWRFIQQNCLRAVIFSTDIFGWLTWEHSRLLMCVYICNIKLIRVCSLIPVGSFATGTGRHRRPGFSVSDVNSQHDAPNTMRQSNHIWNCPRWASKNHLLTFQSENFHFWSHVCNLFLDPLHICSDFFGALRSHDVFHLLSLRRRRREWLWRLRRRWGGTH